MHKKALIVVDVQNGFTRMELENPEAVSKIPAIAERVAQAFANGEIVIFTRDTHECKEKYLGTKEGKNLPVPHCEKGTFGWQIVDELKAFSEKSIIIDKPIFGSLLLADALEKQLGEGNEYSDIELCGFCTEICVNSNEPIITAKFPQANITVDANLTAGVTPEQHAVGLLSLSYHQVDVKNMPEIKITIVKPNKGDENNHG